MANYEDGSTSGVRPGMSPEEAARRLRAHEQPLGKQETSDVKSPLGWTEDKQGETLPGEQPHAVGASEQSPARALMDSIAEQALPVPGLVPVIAAPASGPSGFAAESGYISRPDFGDAARAAAFVAGDLDPPALQAAELAPVG